MSDSKGAVVTAGCHVNPRGARIVSLGRCEICQGRGFVDGVFRDWPCAACDGAGLVVKETGEKMESTAMIEQLRLRLNGALAQNDALRRMLPDGGPSDDYIGRQNNHHRGGGHWTGD